MSKIVRDISTDLYTDGFVGSTSIHTYVDAGENTNLGETDSYLFKRLIKGLTVLSALLRG